MNEFNKASYGAVNDPKMVLQHGKKQELQRTLSAFATFGLAFSNIGILSNTSATFQTVLQRGGPVTMLLCWNIAAVFMICVALSLAETCSMYPESGGLYYWVFELVHNRSNSKTKAATSAFVTGWSYYFGNIIATSANNVTVGKDMVGVTLKSNNIKIALSIGSILNLLTGVHLDKVLIMMIALVVTGLHAYLNIRSLHCLSIINQWNVFWSIAGLTIIIAALSIFAPHQNSMWVFTHYENGTGFDNTFYVFVLAMIGPAYSLFGCECAASVNEETQDADISSPIAIVGSIATAWAVGLVFLIVLLFSIQNMDSILNTSFDMPVAQLFQDAIGTWGTLGFLMMVVICQFCTGATTMTVASRQVYALARDNAAPMSPCLKYINAYRLPENAVALTFALICLITLPFPLSAHLFETIVSATTITIHFSYAMVLGCRLLDSGKKKGRFHLGKWSYFINVLAFTWTAFAVCAFMLPTSWPITCKYKSKRPE
ncbi:hypothetical protein CU097_005529 [Rhizopus azygosporus]|uniref:GABA-specific high-affinity permease n=1 Tax=Rhizopus azygosporus TaxID=86630 RepID=A0A367J0P4_RHIAZ|nr:hypothetical protein CU097_005529 [Rhizopus azygosporus]